MNCIEKKLTLEKFFRYLRSGRPTPTLLYNRTPQTRVNGSALEINLVPEKTCPGDCSYCPYGATSNKMLDRQNFYPVSNVIQEVINHLNRYRSIDQIVLTGSGEPSLNADLHSIICKIKHYTPIPVVLKSCGGLLWRESVRHDCMAADTVHVNIDAADKNIFKIVNNFLLMIPFDRYIDGIMHFRQFFKGNFIVNVTLLQGANTQPDHLDKLTKLIRYLEPEGVNVRTVDGVGISNIVPADRTCLLEFSSRFGRTASVVDAVNMVSSQGVRI
ncbi:MAG TPA: radical SAM protein [Chitinispirillaceae bacterium]|nr:radical SAM protein [Chitinispirillaceae bacterium]